MQDRYRRGIVPGVHQAAAVTISLALALIGAGAGWLIGRELGDTRGLLGWGVGVLTLMAGIFYAGGM